jgi:PhnB protein
LTFYGDVFGCEVQLHTFTEFNMTDGPPDAIARGYLAGGPVALFPADVSGDKQPFQCEGKMLSLLGTAEQSTLATGSPSSRMISGFIDDFRKQPWGAYDGQVIDRYGLPWLSGSRATKKTKRAAAAVFFPRGRLTVPGVLALRASSLRERTTSCVIAATVASGQPSYLHRRRRER